MDSLYTKENNASRARLKKLVQNITIKELNLVIYKEGWTVAVALGHLGFWDQRRAELAKRWRKGLIEKSDITDLSMHTINDALLALFLAMPPKYAADFTVSAAEAVDKELAALTAEQVAQVEKLGDRHALNRGIHRKMHLDEIDTLLKGKRGR